MDPSCDGCHGSGLVLSVRPFNAEPGHSFRDRPLSWSPSGAWSLLCMYPPLEGFFEVLLRGGSSSSNLVNVGKEAIELQTGYPSEIQPPSGRERFWRVVPLGGSTRWGHLIKSFLIRPCINHLVDLTNHRGACGHLIDWVIIGECEVRPCTWLRANDHYADHLTWGSLGACLYHPLLYVVMVIFVFTLLA